MERTGDLRSGASICFRTGKYSDCTVRCEGRSWKVHKLVLCTRSPWFEAALGGEVQVRKRRADKLVSSRLTVFKESRKKVVNISEESPQDVNGLLEYLYKDTYSIHDIEVVEGIETWIQELLFHIAVYKVGDVFLVPGLKSLALRNFAVSLPPNPTSKQLKSIILSMIITNIYSTTPSSDRGLRDTICQYLLPDLDRVLHRPFFECMWKEVDGFAVDLLRLRVMGTCVPGRPALKAEPRTTHGSATATGTF